MLRTYNVHMAFLVLSAVALLIGAFNPRLAAQGTTGTILGTVTDSSGGVVPDANVKVTNAGTGATLTIPSDTQGRYRAPDLPVGDYLVSIEKVGFQSVVHTGITVGPGADVVVDFALPVGQVAQTVTVEGNVTQVETTSSAISTVVAPTQMRDLPLNGRNFENLILLVPGVTNSASPQVDVSSSALAGRSTWWSVSGSRPEGQGELLDGTNIQNYAERGSGSGVLGTTLGVDSIAEFQVLTNTYGAQYGGSGSVVNAVTRSGTNSLHGSAYEFIRNSDLDAKNFEDATRQPYKRNQFGGTLGGPIKKDKMFFFVNYEGVRENLGITQTETVPDSYTLQGLLPSTITGGTAALAGCSSAGAINPAYPTVSYLNCGAGSANAAKFAVIQPYLNLYNPMVAGFAMTETTTSTGAPTGTAQINDTASEPGREDYVVGRYDWTISNSDSIFSRYLIDNGNLTEPFATTPQWPLFDTTRNQFATIGEKHIFSANVINALTLGYTRTFQNVHTVAKLGDLLNWSGDDYSQYHEPIADGTLSPGGGVVAAGSAVTGPSVFAENRFGPSDDVFWTKGAHSLRIGGAAYRIQFNGVHSSTNGAWSFANLQNFFTDNPSSYAGQCAYGVGKGGMPDCLTPEGTPLPLASAQHDTRETQLSMYVQDDWRATSTLTLNLGLRYAPTSNPWDALHQLYYLFPVPLGPSGNVPSASANGTPLPSTFTPENNFMLRNPSLHNIDPRIGVAWDPFKDHKTAVRAGYGIFHAVLQTHDYSYGGFYTFPFTNVTQTAPTNALTFPDPFTSPITGTTSETYGFNPFARTPYLQQWNLTIQHEIMKNTVVTIAYVGSHGLNLIEQADENPPVAAGAVTLPGAGSFCGLAIGSACGGISVAPGQTIWPSFPGEFQSLVSVSGGSPVYNQANGTITCATACTLATANGQPIVDPATGQQVYSHIVASAPTSFNVVVNNRLNINFGSINAGQTRTYSHYNALQAGLIHRMTNNFSLQVSYTYSDCIDLSSGSQGSDGGTNALDSYDLNVDRGPCNFEERHNVVTNGLYEFPFKKNQLVAGWELGGLMFFNTGLPLTINGLSGGAGTGTNRPDYVPNNPGCNNQPANLTQTNPNTGVTGGGFFYINPNCFVAAPIGELGNVGRNSIYLPDDATFNANLQKMTRVSERLSIQFRVEAFNLFNRKNFTWTGRGSVVLSTEGTTSASAIETATTTSSFGQFLHTIGYPLNGAARQLQFGLKFIF